LVEDKRELKSGTQVYYFVLHRFKEGKKWRYRKCAIGAEQYINVTKTHDLPLLGIHYLFSTATSLEKNIEILERAVRNTVKALAVETDAGKLEHAAVVLKALAETLLKAAREAGERSEKKQRSYFFFFLLTAGLTC